jgi:hypothetical protein
MGFNQRVSSFKCNGFFLAGMDLHSKMQNMVFYGKGWVCFLKEISEG